MCGGCGFRSSTAMRDHVVYQLDKNNAAREAYLSLSLDPKEIDPESTKLLEILGLADIVEGNLAVLSTHGTTVRPIILAELELKNDNHKTS